MWTRTEKSFSPPPEVKSTLNQLSDAGFDAYLVGGCVRDFLRGQLSIPGAIHVAIKDFDIATNAKPEQIKQIFLDADEVGKAFGVIKVSNTIEIATYRKESAYRDHRRPSKVEFSTLEADVLRRDFTINALYYDIKTNKIFDQVGGLDDLAQKKIRAVGEASERFSEDALRMLRAVRFAARFGFKIEPQTAAAIRAAAPIIRKISMERVRDEIEKMLIHSSCREAFLELEALGLAENILPEISVAKLDQKKVSDQTLRVLGNLSVYSGVEPISFYWAALFLPTLRLLPIEKREQEARKIAERLKLSTESADEMAYLVRETPKFKDAFSMREATLFRWMREKNFELLMRFHELDAVTYDGNLAGLEFVKSIYDNAKQKFANKPLLTGEDLVKLGMTPGPTFAAILGEVEDLSLEGKLTTQAEALEYVLKHFI